MQQASELDRIEGLGALSQTRRFGIGAGILAFVAAMIASAYVTVPVPWSPVPMTLQPMVALLAGVTLGPVAGAAAMATYLTLGMGGAPVFAGGMAGLPWLVGVTGGYLMAFPAAALVAGFIAGRGQGLPRLLLGLVVGLGVIYLGGITQLAVLTGQGGMQLLSIGVLPFLAGDLVKVVLALILAMAFRARGLGR